MIMDYSGFSSSREKDIVGGMGITPRKIRSKIVVQQRKTLAV